MVLFDTDKRVIPIASYTVDFLDHWCLTGCMLFHKLIQKLPANIQAMASEFVKGFINEGTVCVCASV